MIGGIGRLLVAGLVLASGLAVGQLLAPTNVFACSCARIGTLADLAGQPDVYVLSGTIHDIRDNRGSQQATFAVARVYQGALPALSVPIRGGGGGDCTIDLRQATNVLIVSRFENGTLVPGLCSPLGDLSTPEGQQLLAEANATWPIPVAPTESPDVRGFDPGQLVILVVAPLIAIGLLVGIAALIRRRDVSSDVS